MSHSNSTQCDRVRAYLETHGHITPMEALNELGIFRLGARVFELRESGMPIETCREEVRCRNGETAVVARYVLMRAPRMPVEQIECFAQ